MIIEVFYASFVLFALGVGLRMSLRLLYGARGPNIGDPVYLIMNVLGWVLIILPALLIAFLGASWLSPLIVLITMMAIVEWVLARRELQRQCIWALLNGEIGQGEAPVEFLRAHQKRFTGTVGRAFRRLVDTLEEGFDMQTAIAYNPRAVPRHALALVSIGELKQDKPNAENQTALQQQNVVTESMQNLTISQIYQRTSYLVSILLMIAVVLTFLMIKIVPAYQSIFEDFDLELPRSTQMLIGTADAPLFQVLAWILCLGFVVAVLLGAVIFFCYLVDYHALRPFTDRLLFSSHRAAVLRLLSLAVQRKLPLPDVLRQLAFGNPSYPSALARRHLGKAFYAVNDGEDWKDALREGSFIKKSDYPMLETGQEVGNLPWVLSMLAGQKVRSMVYRWTTVEQILFPLTVLSIGLFVLFVCVSLFIPIVDLINGMS